MFVVGSAGQSIGMTGVAATNYWFMQPGGNFILGIGTVVADPTLVNTWIVTPAAIELAGVGQIAIALVDAGNNVLDIHRTEVVDSLPNSVLQIVTGLLDLTNSIETGLTVRQALRLMSAVLGGTCAVAGGNPTYKGAGVATTRVAATLGGGGVRSAMTLTL